jgi:hypothetical protein
MEIPNTEVPEEMNWADYCDALRNERFLRAVYDRKPLQGSEHLASVAEDENSDLAKGGPLT